MPAGLRVHHLALRSRDPARLARFYGDLLGLAVARRDEARGSVWLRAGAVVLMIERAPASEPAPDPGSQELLAFGLDPASDRPGLDAWRARLDAAGVGVEAETAFTIYFRDPEGRKVALSVYDFDRAATAG
ncbi:MAG TPA: VOC family protein [Polyangiaceae bacterium]|nr:VOC family protein [Polyangiaceae bacterium]